MAIFGIDVQVAQVGDNPCPAWDLVAAIRGLVDRSSLQLNSVTMTRDGVRIPASEADYDAQQKQLAAQRKQAAYLRLRETQQAADHARREFEALGG